MSIETNAIKIHIGCFAHLLNLAIQDVFHGKLDKIVQQVRTFVKKTHYSHKFSTALKEIQIHPLKLILDVRTR